METEFREMLTKEQACLTWMLLAFPLVSLKGCRAWYIPKTLPRLLLFRFIWFIGRGGAGREGGGRLSKKECPEREMST